MLVLADRGVQGACEDLSITGQVVTHPREKVSERRPCKFARSETGRRWLSYRLPGYALGRSAQVHFLRPGTVGPQRVDRLS